VNDYVRTQINGKGLNVGREINLSEEMQQELKEIQELIEKRLIK
jgi:hypothetical protein